MKRTRGGLGIPALHDISLGSHTATRHTSIPPHRPPFTPPPSLSLLRYYTQSYDFESMSFVDALRAYLTPFRLPGEAQKIDRIMNCFSAHYHQTNPQVRGLCRRGGAR